MAKDDTTSNASDAQVESLNYPDTAAERIKLISMVEPFLDFQTDDLRRGLIDQMLVERNVQTFSMQLQNLETSENISSLVTLLAKMQSEVQYLRTALIESTRQSQPLFELNLPKPPRKVVPSEFTVNLNADITGCNWWNPEPDGRWAGPENQSTLQVPSLGAGHFRIEIVVLAEIAPGIIDTMSASINRHAVTLTRKTRDTPAVLVGTFSVPPEYKFPFFSIKFDFQRLLAPSEMGLPDPRRLSVKIQSVSLTKAF